MAQHPVQQRLIASMLAELVRVRRDTRPDLACAPEDVRKVVVAQNALRTCIEAAVTDAIPFGTLFPIELAIRLASYAVSILPDDEHAAAIEAIVTGLPSAHRSRMALGVRIKTEWEGPN